MRDAVWRVLIAVSTALLIVVTYLMILLTSPRMLVGVTPNDSVSLVVTTLSDNQSSSAYPVNVNVANAQELMTVPGLGEVLSERIIRYRDENGAFQSIDELTAIEGIGDSKVALWRDYLSVQ